MARSARLTAAKPKPAARGAAVRPKPEPITPKPVALAPAKAKTAKKVVKSAGAKTNSPRAPVATIVPTRITPPSKGELRAQIENLEAANAALKAKSREANRVAKAANKHINELEAEIARLRDQTAEPAVEKPTRRGRSPRSREIDPGDGVPPGIAVLDPEPLDAVAEATRDALEKNLSGE